MICGEISDPWMRIAEKIILEGEEEVDKEPIFEILNEEVKIQGKAEKEIFDIKEDKFINESCDFQMIDWMRKNFFDTTPVLDWGYSYGARIGNKINLIIEKLKMNSLSKSATISLMDYQNDKQHVPCVTTLDFKVRHNKLYFNVQMRSQDIGKKAFADYICYADIARKICIALELQNYEITVWINSAHIYQTDLKKIENLVEKYFGIGDQYLGQAQKWSNLAKTGEWDEILNNKKSYTNLDNAYGEFAKTLKSFTSQLNKNSQILDLGCGNCELFSVPKNVSQKNLFGIDIAKGMIDCAKKQFPDANLFVGDATKFKSDKKFKIIYSRGVLANHIGPNSWKTLMDNAFEMLELKGIFMFDFLNRNWTEKRSDVHQPNKVLYSPRAVRNLISKTKFANFHIQIINEERRSPIVIIEKGSN